VLDLAELADGFHEVDHVGAGQLGEGSAQPWSASSTAPRSTPTAPSSWRTSPAKQESATPPLYGVEAVCSEWNSRVDQPAARTAPNVPATRRSPHCGQHSATPTRRSPRLTAGSMPSHRYLERKGRWAQPS
jgi:hypothetical protein